MSRRALQVCHPVWPAVCPHVGPASPALPPDFGGKGGDGRGRLWGALFGAALLLGGCGYHAVYGSEGSERLHVVLARAVVADAVAADEVVSGVREELARSGSLAAGDSYPRVEIEVTRLDEASDAIRAEGAPDAQAPAARATEVGIVARAWLARSVDGPRERETGDVRVLVATRATQAGEATATASAAAVDALRYGDALHAAGRRAGVRIARRILGEPAPEEDVEGEWQGRFR